MVAILHPTGPGPQIPIDRAVVLIGRSPECDVVLDISSKISRLHCALVQVDAEYHIRDLGSLNGVNVSGQRIEKDVKLTNGAEVVIGDVRFLFLENVMPVVKTAKPIHVKGVPVFVDETVEVLDSEPVDVEEDDNSETPVPRRVRAGAPPERMPKLGANFDNVHDSEVLDVVEISDEIHIIEDDDILNDEDVIEVDVIEDVDIIDDVEIIEEPPLQSGPGPNFGRSPHA